MSDIVPAAALPGVLANAANVFGVASNLGPLLGAWLFQACGVGQPPIVRQGLVAADYPGTSSLSRPPSTHRSP
eukprot:5570526-Prymnesium_polylepis.1